MNIAIIGASNVGGALGKGWAKAGHTISFGVDDPGQAKAKAPLAAMGDTVTARTVTQAAYIAEIIVLATPWPAVAGVIGEMGDLRGKVVIDCTNPLSLDSDGGLGLSLGGTTSGAEEIARQAAGARVAKAFNTYGWENLANASYPGYGEAKPVMFYCSDDDHAKEIVDQLAKDLGFDPVDTGGLGMARSLEPLALLWLSLSVLRGRNPNFIWAMLQR